MSDYIRREDALDAFGEEYVPRTDFERGMVSQMSCDKEKIKALPSADVVHVRHGTWIDMGWHGDWQWETDGRGNCWHLWKCNRCDGKVKIKTDFCPNCGAKMDGKE